MIKKKLFLIIFTSIFLVSCSQKNNIIDFDISDLPKPKNIQPAKDEIEELTQQDNKKFIKDLDIFQSRDKLLSKVNIGKNNPFSKGETELNKFSSNFKLTGFLNTETKQYVFVSYLGNEGTISKDSVGGVNTNLLPNGAKVMAIDSKEKQLKISFDNEDYIFEF
tara:strand:+ start:956 stop:1447 length:492 start_codon:yes stop_codon:yes gene_type:complete